MVPEFDSTVFNEETPLGSMSCAWCCVSFRACPQPPAVERTLPRKPQGTLQVRPQGKSRPSPEPQREVHVTALENRLTETLGTKVVLKYRAGKGSLNIKFFSDDDLERILKLLGVESE